MKLKYTGPAPVQGTINPLPEGWPPFDHEESSELVAREKIDSKLYAGETSRSRSTKADSIESEESEE